MCSSDLTASFFVFAICSFWRAAYNLDASFAFITAPQYLQGVATAMFFVPLLGITMAGLPPDKIASAAGLANFLRILASSFGTSLSTTLWEDRANLHHAQLTASLTPYEPNTTALLNQLQASGMEGDTGLAMLERMVNGQAFMMATIDYYWLAGWIFICLVPLVWLARPPFMVQGRRPPPVTE